MAQLNSRTPYRIDVDRNRFNEYLSLMNGERDSWEIEDKLYPRTALAHKHRCDQVCSDAILGSEVTQQDNPHGVFREYTPQSSIEAVIRLENVRKMGIDVGQEVQFSFQGDTSIQRGSA